MEMALEFQIVTVDGDERQGQVLEIEVARHHFHGDTMGTRVSGDMIGRRFNGSDHPRDAVPPVLFEQVLDIDIQPIDHISFDMF